MLLHNVIKINYVRDGYLPNHPYHQISDKEMFDAFIVDKPDVDSYFTANYPCDFLSTKREYTALKEAIEYHINNYLTNGVSLPSWVYSYMLGEVVGPYSSQLARHDLLVLLNLDNVADEFTEAIYRTCYEVSSDWIHKLPPAKSDHRPPTIFGEPHVIKSLRLLQADILS